MDEPTVERRKAVTIYDVAKAAGVAASTVSRALTRPGRVAEHTAAHIREVADRLRYVAKSPARHGVQRASKTLLVAVVGLGNLYYHQTLEGIHSEAAKTDHDVIVVDCRGMLEPERAAFERARVIAAGVIMISPRLPDAELLGMAQTQPLVVVNRLIPGVHSVVQNVPDGMRQVVAHLRDLGHRYITYIGGPSESWIHITRWDAIRSASDELGVRVSRIGPFDGSGTPLGGIHAAETWLRDRTSAVVAYNDDTALGFMRAVMTRGVRVPEDVSVVGIDNSSMAQLFVPSLTSLALAGYAQGAAAARSLVDTLGGEEPRTGASVVPMKLIVGESTGPVGTA